MFIGLQLFMVISLFVATVAYYLSNIRSYRDSECYDQGLVNCKGTKALNWILTIYLLLTIAKNVFISSLLFYSLYRFYSGLRQINLQFEIEKTILAIHIAAFGTPIISGFGFVICIIVLN